VQAKLDRREQDDKAYAETLAAAEKALGVPFNPLQVSLVANDNVLACVPPCTRDAQNVWPRTFGPPLS